jgi:murein DD-endopeptidase MepM/ murein hydrolase activator NlpD
MKCNAFSIQRLLLPSAMSYQLSAFLLLITLSSCGVQHRFASKEESLRDSSYVYALPYRQDACRFLIQGYRSRFSHKNRLALDFKMKKGSDVLAAREGVVVRLEESFTRGGVSKKYYRKANQVVIRHSDGSQAYYGHLLHNGVLVNVGDRVSKGQVIAKSGSTGYSATPHLHFIVWGPTRNGQSQLPTRFQTKKGIRYLKAGRWYKGG